MIENWYKICNHTSRVYAKSYNQLCRMCKNANEWMNFEEFFLHWIYCKMSLFTHTHYTLGVLKNELFSYTTNVTFVQLMEWKKEKLGLAFATCDTCRSSIVRLYTFLTHLLPSTHTIRNVSYVINGWFKKNEGKTLGVLFLQH